MAILKDLIVHGVSRFLGAIYGEKFVKTGGTSSLFLKADGSVDSSTYLTTETDPTVPSWAKQSSKPSYTASEVGAYTETQVNNLLANKEDKVVTISIGFGDAITTDGIDASEYTKIANANSQINKPLIRDAYGSILHVIAGDNTGEYKLIGFDSYGNVRIVTVGPGVMGSDYEILDVQSMPIEQFTESDPTVPSYVKSITQANITSWNGKQAALVSGTNIKTVNGTSLLGSGDIAVVSVDAGNISVLQSTGDSQVDVMSQKAVSEKVERLNEHDLDIIETLRYILPTGYTEVEYIDNNSDGTANGTAYIDTNVKLQTANCRIIGSWKRTGSVSSNSLGIIGDPTINNINYYSVSYSNTTGQSVLMRAGNNNSGGVTAILTEDIGWHYFDIKKGFVVLDGTEYEYTGTSASGYSSNSIKTGLRTPLRFGKLILLEDDIVIAYLVPCKFGSSVGMYDVVRETFFSSANSKAFVAGNEVISPSDKVVTGYYLQKNITQELGNSKLKILSQDAIRKELKVSENASNITYLTGRLANFKFTDYPQFDPRTCDGISIVLSTSLFTSDRVFMFGIMDSSKFNNGCGDPHFGLWTNWGSLVFGKCTGYGNTTDGGYSYGNVGVERHVVFTYDFKTGIVKCYKNGVLINTQTPSSYSEQTLIRNYFNTCTHLFMSSFKYANGGKMKSIALFGSVLTDSDVSELYGSGYDSIRNTLIPEKWEANYLHPLSVTGWTINFFTNGGVATQNNDGGYTIIPTSGLTNVYFGFNDISCNIKNNLIYEWDFEITRGSSTHDNSERMSRAMRIGGAYFKCFTIYDSNGNDVTLSTLGIGTYHVVSKPNNIGRPFNATSVDFLHYYFICSSDFSMTISPILKITERGAALEYSTKTYKGEYWLQSNGTKMPINTSFYYSTEAFNSHTDTYVEEVVNYSGSIKPQYNGQMAIDVANSKIYIGYLNGNTSVWKQINNS